MSDSRKKRAPKDPKETKVSLIEDPYSFSTLEIQEAQASEEELDLDEGAADDAEGQPVDLAAPVSQEEFDRLAKAVANAESESESESEADQLAADGPTPEEELAAQIAEDQALQAQVKAEEDAEREAAGAPAMMLGASGELDLDEVQSCVEALLFISDKPMPAKRLRDLLGPELELGVFEQAIARVQEEYSGRKHGFELVEVNGGFQFRTKPGRSDLAKKLVRVQVQRLSTGGMETLALVAYKQPVMKEDIDKVRGVDSSYFIRGLLDRKLIKIVGRSELPGRPMLYATTDEFLELFGLADLSSLPPLHEIEKMVPASESARPEDEDPRVREMRRLVAEMKASGSDALVGYDPKEDARILQDIKDRVGAIPSTTPYLEEQRANEKIAKFQAELAEKIVLEIAPVAPEPLIIAPAAPEEAANSIEALPTEPAADSAPDAPVDVPS